jgi:hypothetical protein
MKFPPIIFATALFSFTQLALAQSFVNLDFNSAYIPFGTPSGSTVAASDAIPGWTGYLGVNQQTSVLYDTLALGSAEIAILDSNSQVPGIPGNSYTVVLQAGYGGTGVGNLSASIAQTASIPSTAKTILFEASLPYSAGWQVTIAGQNIPVTEISSINSGLGVYAGNVSAYAGQLDTLEFTALSGTGSTVNLFLDSISFSNSAIPEPSEFALFTAGALSFGFWRWRKSPR